MSLTPNSTIDIQPQLFSSRRNQASPSVAQPHALNAPVVEKKNYKRVAKCFKSSENPRAKSSVCLSEIENPQHASCQALCFLGRRLRSLLPDFTFECSVSVLFLVSKDKKRLVGSLIPYGRPKLRLEYLESSAHERRHELVVFI